MTPEPSDTVSATPEAADAWRTLNAELLGDCRWTYQQNQAVLAALKKENKELKALLAQLPAGTTNGRVALASELRDLDLQANALRRQHDRLVQDRLSSTNKLAQLKDSLKDLHCDSQLVFAESPGSRLVTQLQQKLTAALAKHDAAQATCHTLEETAHQLQEHRQTHDSQLAAVEGAVAARKSELEELLTSHKAVQLAKDDAKADLALVEQQLSKGRAERAAQLQHHSALVQRRQEEYQALHEGAMQRLQHWKRRLFMQQPGAVAGPADTAGSLGADASGPRSPSARALAGCAQLGSPTEAVHATQAASTGTATETTAAACKSTPKAVQASSPLTGPLDEATPHAGGANEGIGADIDPAAAVSIGAATVKQSSVASAELAPADSDPTGTVAAATNAAATVATTNAAAATNDGAAADAAAVPAAIDANAAANTAATAADAAAAATNVATAADAAATTNAAAVAATNAAADAAASAPAHMGHAAIAADRGSSYSPASTAATPMPESGCALEDSTLSGVKQDGDDDPTPELSCRQAFAATQFATGVADMTDLVDRFLTQDATRVTLQQLGLQSQAYLQDLQKRSAALQTTLEELQLGRSLLHRQAEAAIKEADAQIKLNKGQYEHVGRLLVHAKAAIQALITRLEPLFPEIAGMGVSSDGLVEAIHGCELRLIHAYEAVLAFQSKSHSKIPAGVAGEGNRVSEVQLQLQGTDLKPNMFSANASEVARPLPEGVSSILRQPEVA